MALTFLNVNAIFSSNIAIISVNGNYSMNKVWLWFQWHTTFCINNIKIGLAQLHFGIYLSLLLFLSKLWPSMTMAQFPRSQWGNQSILATWLKQSNCAYIIKFHQKYWVMVEHFGTFSVKWSCNHKSSGWLMQKWNSV